MSRKSRERWKAKQAANALNCSPQVFKVQRPLATNEPQPLLLMYNEDRSVTLQMVATKQMLKWFKPDQYKIFVIAEVKNDVFLWGEAVPDPGW